MVSSTLRILILVQRPLRYRVDVPVIRRPRDGHPKEHFGRVDVQEPTCAIRTTKNTEIFGHFWTDGQVVSRLFLSIHRLHPLLTHNLSIVRRVANDTGGTLVKMEVRIYDVRAMWTRNQILTGCRDYRSTMTVSSCRLGP